MYRMISSDYSSEDDEVEDESLVLQPSKKLPVIIFRPEVTIGKFKKWRSIGEKYNLRFKFQRGGTSLIRNILTGFGFKECSETSADYNLLWMNSHVKPFSLRNMTEYQRVNHFPRSFELTRKDRLARNVDRMAQTKSAKLFDFVPRSFMMPSEYQDFCQAAVRDKGPWIVKPIASSRGRGIYLVNNPNQVPLDDSTMVCKYLGNPLLVDGFKFDIRLYVAVTSYDPLIIYLYEEGMARFATIKYDTNNRHLKNQWMHLTNYSINKKNNDYVKSDDADLEDYGNKWTLGALLRYLREEGVDTKVLMSKIEQVIIKSIIAVESPIAQATKMFVPFRGNCSELYGFDILIDDNLKPWVLEVNLSPSLATDAPLDLKIKSNVISDFFNLMGVEAHDPSSKKQDPKVRNHPLSGRNKNNNNKHSETSGISVGGPTSGISAEDARLIKWVKDQHSRRGGFVRIFPREETWSAYGGLLEFKTHTNELIAARLFPDTYRSGSAIIRSRTTEDKMTSSGGKGRFNQYERRLLAFDSSERKKERRRIRRTRKLKKKKRVEVTSDLDDDEEEAEDEESTSNQYKTNTNTNKQTKTTNEIDQKADEIAEIPVKKSSSEQILREKPGNSGPKSPPTYIENSQIYQSIKSSKQSRSEIGQGDQKLEIFEKNDCTKNADNATKNLELPKTTGKMIQKNQVDNLESAEAPIPDRKLDVTLENETIEPADEKPSFKLKEIVTIIKRRARDLCQIEAREAFATYLLRVQQRFMIEANGQSHAYQSEKSRDDQIELVCRFLTRASGNLENPLELNLPEANSVSIKERKKIIGNLLIEFTQRYNKETNALISSGQQSSSDIAPREKFEFFLKFCSEQEVEDILTIYTQENKSASVFLGAKKPKQKSEPRYFKTHTEIVQAASEKVKEENDAKDRRRAISLDRSQKLLNRPTSLTNSPFEQSVRGAAYIYTTKPGSKSSRPPPALQPCPSEDSLKGPLREGCQTGLESGSPHNSNMNSNVNQQANRPPSATTTAIPTTASEAIKLALKKLSERNLQDKETQRVSHLAQQLAKLNQNANRSLNRPSSATVQRNSKYTSKYRNSIKTDGSMSTTAANICQPSRSRNSPGSHPHSRDSSVDRNPRTRSRPKSAHTSYNQHTRVCWK